MLCYRYLIALFQLVLSIRLHSNIVLNVKQTKIPFANKDYTPSSSTRLIPKHDNILRACEDGEKH